MRRLRSGSSRVTTCKFLLLRVCALRRNATPVDRVCRFNEAIAMYKRAKRFNHAIRIAKDNGLDNQIMALALEAPDSGAVSPKISAAK